MVDYVHYTSMMRVCVSTYSQQVRDIHTTLHYTSHTHMHTHTHTGPLQAIANESGINFISVKGPELLNMVSAWRELASKLMDESSS